MQNLVERGHRKISPFFIPYAITNMCAWRIHSMHLKIITPHSATSFSPRTVSLSDLPLTGLCSWLVPTPLSALTVVNIRDQVSVPGS